MRARRIGILVAIGLAGVGAAVVLLGRRSVIFSWKERGTVSQVPVFSIFNPFRDRGPERSADEFLTGSPEAATRRAPRQGGLP